MYKAGDIVPFRIRLLKSDGSPETYADKTAFLAGGYTVNYDLEGAAATPVWTFVVRDAVQGDHDIMLTIQEGNGYLTVTEPAGHEVWPRTRPVSAEKYNLGSVIGLITSTNGTPINQDRATVTDITVTEGDGLVRNLVVPLAALNDWGFSDLTDPGWTVTAAARKRENRLAAQPDFLLGAYITDTINRIVTLALNPFATGAEIGAVATQESQDFLFDMQLANTLSYVITAVNTGAKQFTVAGDRRKLVSLNAAPVTSIIIVGGANAGTYTVTAVAYVGGNTVFTVSQVVPSAVVAGNLTIGIKFSPNKGTIRTGRQEDRT